LVNRLTGQKLSKFNTEGFKLFFGESAIFHKYCAIKKPSIDAMKGF
jgi:hypothetical protein